MPGTGSGYFAAREAVAEARRQQAQWEDRRQRRLAAPRGGGAHRAPYPCYFFCLDCGRVDERRTAPCPACGSEAIADLGDESVFRQICEWDRVRRHTVPFGWRLLGAVLGAVAGAGLFFVVASYLGHTLPDIARGGGWLAGALLGGALGYGAVLPSVAARLRALGASHPPLRWRLPAEETLAVQASRGLAQVAAETLRAPFSNEPCAAYRIRVFFDVAGDAAPELCVLEESDSAELFIGGQRYRRGTLIVADDSPAAESTPSFSEAEEPLRMRGLDASDGDFRVLQWTIPVDTNVEVSSGVIRVAAPRIDSSDDAASNTMLAQGSG